MRIFERMNNRDRHNQQSKKKAGEAALKVGNHEEAFRLFTEVGGGWFDWMDNCILDFLKIFEDFWIFIC